MVMFKNAIHKEKEGKIIGEIHLYDLDVKRLFCREKLAPGYEVCGNFKGSSEILRDHCSSRQNRGELVCGQCVSSLYGHGKHSSKRLDILEMRIHRNAS